MTTADLFTDLHRAHRSRIEAYLQRLTGERAQAEDLAQETFLRARRGLEALRDEGSTRGWLYRIATRVYLDHRRGVVRRPEQLWATVPDASNTDPRSPAPPLPDRLFEDSEMGRCIREFVQGLSPDWRAVIVLHDLEGLKNREIADILGCTLETVKIRVHRARRALGATLAEHCEFYRDDRDVLRCDRKQPSDLS